MPSIKSCDIQFVLDLNFVKVFRSFSIFIQSFYLFINVNQYYEWNGELNNILDIDFSKNKNSPDFTCGFPASILFLFV